MRPPRFLVGFTRDRHHRTDPWLAAQPSHQSAQQHLDVNNIGLCPPCPPVHREARRLNHLNFDAASAQKTRQPKPVTPRFMREYHPSNLRTRRCAPGLYPLDESSQLVATSVQNVSRMAANPRQLNGE